MVLFNSVAFKKRHNVPANYGLNLKEISTLSRMPIKALREVYKKGVGAYHTNRSSVRPTVKSPEQWAMARVYAFVMKKPTVYRGADDSIRAKYNLR